MYILKYLQSFPKLFKQLYSYIFFFPNDSWFQVRKRLCSFCFLKASIQLIRKRGAKCFLRGPGPQFGVSGPPHYPVTRSRISILKMQILPSSLNISNAIYSKEIHQSTALIKRRPLNLVAGDGWGVPSPGLQREVTALPGFTWSAQSNICNSKLFCLLCESRSLL